MKIVNNVNDLLEALGGKKGDTINIVTPQFEREYELSINFKPNGLVELKALIDTCPADILLKMGVRKWSNYEENKDDDHMVNDGAKPSF
jgi:hypothetical protein